VAALTALASSIIIFSFRSQNILDLLRTKVLLETLADVHPTVAMLLSALRMGRLRARCKLGFDLNTRSITPVMNLGLLGLPSMARSS
jgi:hypothetical protein